MKSGVAACALAVPMFVLGGLQGAHAQETAEAGGRAATAAREAPLDPEGIVRIEGPAGATLERETDSVQHDWEAVCTAPCTARTSTAFNYRVAGGGLKPSQGFALRVDPGQTEDLHVHGAWLGLYVLGWTGIAAGGAAAITGLAVGLWSATSAVFSLPPPSDDPAVGWIVLGAGAAVVVGGLVLVLTNGHTAVSQDVVEKPTGPDLSTATPSPLPQVTAAETSARFLRTGPAFGVPVVSLHF